MRVANYLIVPSGVYYDYILANPPFVKKEQSNFYQRRRPTGKRRPDLQSAGFLGNHQQQTTELRSEHPLDA
jgi:methylase of polypeptide subunit release factors